RYLHVVDLDGAQSGRQVNRECVRQLVNDSGLKVQLGGGVRDIETVIAWLEAGVQRLVIGSLAVTEPDTVMNWMHEFGADRFVLALDCRCDESAVPWLATHGWVRQSSVTLWDSIARYDEVGLRHVLCTDVSRDGAMSGPSLVLYREFRQRFPGLALQASGGVRNIGDLDSLRELGASAAITGRALLDGCISAQEISSFRQNA
ncbi:MAG: 1-(5-phosphoribosyl)-5-[(5-phosphoribosylamino)methylideneamino] imidazole-4-carboxamide isomerase, partial [Halioglobus sp.]|nr:1-(5-phosphoribosyl)-5-[(5-phosphoribosylamino)methylideneamino] imidazole-4-carboxamide isomerase [Halioglobus sp.]